MSQWPPDRTSFLFMVALAISLLWMAAAVAGKHPDGSILGFAGTLLVVWSTTSHEKRRRHRRRYEEQEAAEADEDPDEDLDEEDDWDPPRRHEDPYDWRHYEEDR